MSTTIKGKFYNSSTGSSFRFNILKVENHFKLGLLPVSSICLFNLGQQKNLKK